MTPVVAIHTISEDFDTSGSETSVSRADDLFGVVAPVIGGFVEVGHTIDSNLTCQTIRSCVFSLAGDR